MDAATYRNPRRTNRVSSSNRLGPRNRYAKALLSMQPGDSFTIRKDIRLRMRGVVSARYYGIPIATRTISSDEIRVWRVDNVERTETDPIVVRTNVPPPG